MGSRADADGYDLGAVGARDAGERLGDPARLQTRVGEDADPQPGRLGDGGAGKTLFADAYKPPNPQPLAAERLRRRAPT